MLKEKLNGLIKEAMMNKDKVRLETLRSIKTAFMNYETAKNSKPLNDSAEVQILRKLISSREESVAQYTLAGRIESAENEKQEISIIQSFLPAAISENDIKDFLSSIITQDTTIRDMGRIVKEVKSKFPTAEGKLVADLVKEVINGNMRR